MMLSRLSSWILTLLFFSSLSRVRVVSADIIEYNFSIGYFVASPDGSPVNILGINNQIPSPTINVRQGDTLVVNVVNNDPIHSHSLHWHGLSQKGSSEMDGVVGITQCGLPPSRSMTYRFNITDSPGTYWYHGHSGLTKNGARGIAGMLIVRPKEGSEDVHGDLYTEENELFLQDWSHDSPNDHYMKSLGGLHPPVAQSADAHNVALYPWTSGLMNGFASPEMNGGITSVIQLNHTSENGIVRQSASRTRLRIVNGGENFALRVSVDNHRLLIISTDGTDMEQLEVDSVIVHLGERYDAILVPREDHESLQSSKSDGNFWIRARTLESDEGAQIPMNNEIRGILRYGGAPPTFPSTQPYPSEKEVVLNCFDSSFILADTGKNSKCLPITALRTHSSIKSHYARLIEREPDETHEVAFEHSRGSKHYGHFTRVRANVYDEVVPSRASHREGDFTQFVLPSRPSYVNDGLDGNIYHDHTLNLDITHGNGVQIIWNHQSKTAHPIHIHGYKFVVAATHEADVFERCSIVDCQDENDWFSWPIHKHIIDDTLRDGFVVKDTVVLPAGGYLVTRLIADNPGEWLAHCHTDFHFTDGMGLILREKTPLGESGEKIRPQGFPECSGMEYEAFDLGAMSARQPACQCLADPETILNAAPEMEWKCSKEHLCRHEAVINKTIVDATDNIKDQRNSEKVRGLPPETIWNQVIMIFWSINGGSVLLYFIVKRKPSDELSEDDSKTRSLVRLIYYDEWSKRMTIVAFVQVLGLSCVSGAIYFESGLEVGERVFREKIAFVFWMCAFWSIGTIYSSIVTYYSDSWSMHDGAMLYQNVSRRKKGSKPKPDETIDPDNLDLSSSTLQVLALRWPEPESAGESSLTFERTRGRNSEEIQHDNLRVSILSYHLARWAIGFPLSSPFAFLFAMVTDAFTQMAPNVRAVFLTALILLLTQQSFDALGRLLAEISGRNSVGRAVCLGTIVSQALVIAGGFYRTVHPVLSAIGPIRYSFSAISKLHFSSSDSFWCTPDRALAWRGYTWCPLELSGAIADLKFRGIDIVNSYKTPSVWPDVLSLIGIITFLRVACYVVAVFKAWRKQRNQKNEEPPRERPRRPSMLMI